MNNALYYIFKGLARAIKTLESAPGGAPPTGLYNTTCVRTYYANIGTYYINMEPDMVWTGWRKLTSVSFFDARFGVVSDSIGRI